MVSLHQTFQKNLNLKAVIFILVLFAFTYLRHIFIGNWEQADRSSYYAYEEVLWLKKFFLENNISYSGTYKGIANGFFLLIFGAFGLAFFHINQLRHQKKWFLILYFGLALLFALAYFLALKFSLHNLELRARECIVFLQTPFTFVLVYFSHFLQAEKQNT